jgi:FAD/FMN-containing dehydrogenase
MESPQSWGRYPRLPPGSQGTVSLTWQPPRLPAPPQGGSLLPYGLGRSYGDSCLNPDGSLLLTSGLDRFVSFDPATGLLTCEAGVTFDAILRLVVPQGWFLPVTPGTKFVTLGGAIANDVHGKNHHAEGTLGRHVRRLGLLRSDGKVRICSPMRETDLFGATIGGLGLTGLILWAELKLLRIQNPFVVQETLAFENLEEFLAINRASVDAWPYTVSWVDCVARGRNLGRGVYFRGRSAPPQLEPTATGRSHLTHAPLLRVPFQLPGFSLNQLTVGIFNRLYRWSNLRKASPRLLHYDPFFYPLDAVLDWNRIYGQRGFLQFQCVVPETDGGAVMRELLERIAHSGQASFLAVLKTFGTLKSPGWLSFPRPGITLALDFRNRGASTLKLFAELDAVVRAAGGAQYPAKDATMSPETFRAAYPELPRFEQQVDPAFSSAFWRRMTGAPRALP